jgi:ornithine carbamoyltransferase
MRLSNVSAKIFGSGLAVSIFRDNSTRTRWKDAPSSMVGAIWLASKIWRKSFWPRMPNTRIGSAPEELMEETNGGHALYMHCLPADISGVSCQEGEVAASVFDRYRDHLYREASYKPYVIAAMIFLAKVKDPAAKLQGLLGDGRPRVF